MLPPWMIDDLKRREERKERENEVGRGLWLPVPVPPERDPRKPPAEKEGWNS
jgi:hypothetical protein